MTDAQAIFETLYMHQKREEWGHAICTWRGDGREHYLFEDGKARMFSVEYAAMMRPVDRPLDRTTAIVRNLKTMVKVTGTRPKAGTGIETPAVSLDEQIAMFRLSYPKGFADPAHLAEHRGAESKTSTKRHRDAAIARAAEVMAQPALDSMLVTSDHTGIVRAVTRLLGSTDLAAKKELDLLSKLEGESARTVSLAVMDLLYGSTPYTERFHAWVRALAEATGRKPTWELATSLAALVFPSEHVAVKGTAFRDQAKWMAPSLSYESQPNALLYERLRTMALTLHARLTEAGLAPHDLLDVRDFVWTTQRPSAKQDLALVRAASASAAAKATTKKKTAS
jgi:hypothetical protein